MNASKALEKAFRGIEDRAVRSELINASGDLEKLGEVLQKISENAENRYWTTRKFN